MGSLYSACNQISENGVFDYSVGNNIISIEAFDSIESYKQSGDSTSQYNIVLIKSETINILSGEILTVANPKKSLVLFCDTLTNNGTISMTGKGPNVLPHDYCIFSQDTVFEDVVIPAYAGNRLERTIIYSNYALVKAGINGNNGVNRQCGSGGQGATAHWASGANSPKALGASGSGYAFGGGAGSGGKTGYDNTTYESNCDVDAVYSMRGAPGFAYSAYGASGGVGNPSGTGEYKSNYNYSSYVGAYQDQNTGVGGRIIIFCNTFINNGIIEANGIQAYSSTMYTSGSGGSSGGGAVDVFYFYSCQQGDITAKGGDAGNLCTSWSTGTGGKGGDGSVTISQLNHEVLINPPISSLYAACNSIPATGLYDFTLGNNNVTIEAFESVGAYEQAGDSTSQDNVVLIKEKTITIDSGKILTVSSPKKSLVLFCDTLVNNGTISMTGKGPNTLPHDYYILHNDPIFEDVIIPAYANNRLERRAVSAITASGLHGNNGTNRNCGSGGQGAATAGNYSMLEKRLGASGSAYAFGGGAGSGGKAGGYNSTFEANCDVDTTKPMVGAPGYVYGYYGSTGGVGQPAGADSYTSFAQYAGCNGPFEIQNIGVGGRIIIFCNTFINSGVIEAKGVSAKIGNLYHSASGGASGGGAIDIFYSASLEQGNVTVDGGASGNLSANAAGWAGADYAIYNGGKGGNGCITTSQLNYAIKLDSSANDNLYTFEYTGKTEMIHLNPGIYNFYCKGAAGGGLDGANGSVSKATIAILEPKDFFVSVGQSPLGMTGGWNGGRNADAAVAEAFGSGGSTDIAVQGIDQSIDWYTTLHLSSRVIMAKGGNGTAGAIGGGLNYIYTELTKDSYPENLCNAGNYYMTNPIFIPELENNIKDGMAYIQRIGTFILKRPYLKDIYYYYNETEQTAILEDIDEEKLSISNNKAINAGLYNILVKPKPGYYWTTRTREDLTIQWRILKANPNVIWPTPTMLDIDSQINKSKLIKGIGKGEFTWVDSSLKMKYPNSGYEAMFIPLDLNNYNIIKKKLSIRAIFLRNNSNLHKDSHEQDFMDFNKILDLMEVKQ